MQKELDEIKSQRDGLKVETKKEETNEVIKDVAIQVSLNVNFIKENVASLLS